jgi:hypothetical protein
MSNANKEHAMKTITWTMGNGKTATVDVTLVTERHLGTVHGQAVTRPCCKIKVVATIDGMGEVGYSYRRVDNHPQGVAAMCGKLGIMEANAQRIDAAIGELKAIPEWISHERAEEQAERDEADYQASTARIAAAMAE